MTNRFVCGDIYGELDGPLVPCGAHNLVIVQSPSRSSSEIINVFVAPRVDFYSMYWFPVQPSR